MLVAVEGFGDGSWSRSKEFTMYTQKSSRERIVLTMRAKGVFWNNLILLLASKSWDHFAMHQISPTQYQQVYSAVSQRQKSRLHKSHPRKIIPPWKVLPLSQEALAKTHHYFACIRGHPKRASNVRFQEDEAKKALSYKGNFSSPVLLRAFEGWIGRQHTSVNCRVIRTLRGYRRKGVNWL